MTFPTRFHRSTAVVAGTFAGLAATLAFVAPAGAATGDLTGTSSCDPAGWRVRWALTTTGTAGATGTLSDVKATITDLVVPPGGGAGPKPPALTVFRDSGRLTGDTTVTDEQLFNPDMRAVELAFTVTWSTGATVTTKNLRATATAPKTCPLVKPSLVALPPPPEPPHPIDDSDTGVGAPGTPAPSWKPPQKPLVTAEPSRSPAEAATPPTTGRATAPASSPAPARVAAVSAETDAGGGLLARTGAAAGVIGGGAVLLLTAGAILLGLARRRKPTFTA